MQKLVIRDKYCYFHWSVKGKLNLLAKTEIKNVWNTVIPRLTSDPANEFFG